MFFTVFVLERWTKRNFYHFRKKESSKDRIKNSENFYDLRDVTNHCVREKSERRGVPVHSTDRNRVTDSTNPELSNKSLSG